jgi:HPt (histidine-containing phosphotransfer) domain-containing protein
MTNLASRSFAAPAFDLDDLMEVVGEPVLFVEVATLAIDDLVRLLGAIDGAGSTAEMADLAHELKGVLLNLTAAAAAAQALAVEHAARSGDETAARSELSGARATIHGLIATLTSATQAAS